MNAMSKVKDNDFLLRNNFEVRLFDETDQIRDDHKALMNERILEMQSRFHM